MNPALAAVGSDELARLARVAEGLLAGRPLLAPGHRPRRQRPGQGSEFLDYRPYRAGDDVRDIDWRASARSRDPQVRRRIEEARSDWYVCLDSSASMSVDAAAWTLARQLAAAWCFLLLHLGHRAGLVSFSDRIHTRLPAGRGHGHYARICRVLERTRTEPAGAGSRPSACAVGLPPRCPAVVVSDCLSADAMRAELTALHARLGEMHLLEIRGDVSPTAATGSALLVDAETGKSRPVPDIRAAAAGASARSGVLSDTLAGWCRNFGIAHTRCATTEQWSRLLTRHLSALMPDGP